jgi:hypothetical protein
VSIFEPEAAIVRPLDKIGDQEWIHSGRDTRGGRWMSRPYHSEQTGIAVLALIIALVALGISAYTYFQVTQRAELQTRLTRMQDLVERGQQEIGDALRRPEGQVRGSQSRESSPRQ